jgi:queuine/archaeosine tRNA-ribosyltransferase
MFIFNLVENARAAIEKGTFEGFRQSFRERYLSNASQ